MGDAQDYKDELNRITKYITDLDAQTRKECDAYSEDVKYWPSTGLASRSSAPGWPSARSLLLEASPSPPTWPRPRLSTTRSPPTTRPASTTSRFLKPLRQPQRR